MKRIHNTKSENLVLKNYIVQKQFHKPRGLWYGINNSWLKWCKSEMPHWVFPHSFGLTINLLKILRISSYEELLDFTNKYGVELYKGSFGKVIDWKEVRQRYWGIEINPYIYKARIDMNIHWYYSWDVASGCIWNKEAIEKVHKIK